ncbi:MAG: hypothetical protein RLZZ214_386 [Verrucomicrobiota bacterium]|jgi:DNA-directed RNA polymerase specialized sigma24 family protein
MIAHEKNFVRFPCAAHIVMQTLETSGPTDAELLAEWLTHRREPAFRALVSRYAPLVHSAATRICGNDALAADASQLVFILLARKAKSLTAHPSLAGFSAAAQRRRRFHLRSQLQSHRPRLEHVLENELRTSFGKWAQPELAAAWLIAGKIPPPQRHHALLNRIR